MVSSLGHEPHGVHRATCARPMWLVEQQIVALGDDEPRRRQHDERGGQRLLQRAVEARHVHRRRRSPASPVRAGARNRRRRTCPGAPLRPRAPSPVELGIGQVEAVHRNVRDPARTASLRDTSGQLPTPVSTFPPLACRRCRGRRRTASVDQCDGPRSASASSAVGHARSRFARWQVMPERGRREGRRR